MYRETAHVHMEAHILHNIEHLLSLLREDRNNPLKGTPKVLNTIDRLTLACAPLPHGQKCIFIGRLIAGVINYVLNEIMFGDDEDITIHRESLYDLCDDDGYKCFDDQFPIKNFVQNWEKLIAVGDVLKMNDAVEAAHEYRYGSYLGNKLSIDEMKRLVILMSDTRDVRNRALRLFIE